MKEKQVFLSKNSPFLYLVIINKKHRLVDVKLVHFFTM